VAKKAGPAGEASSSNMTVTAREPGARSDTSEAPAKPKKQPRRKTEVWRLNNQLAQKRFRQKQKVHIPKRLHAFICDRYTSRQTAHVTQTCQKEIDYCDRTSSHPS
jgi:purine nucleoside permease